MIPAPRPARLAPVLPLGIDAIAAATALAAQADERHVLCQLLALAVREVVRVPGGRVELRLLLEEDVLARLEEAAEVAVPEPVSLLSRTPFSA